MKIKNLLATLALLSVILLGACSKDKDATTYKVKFTVTGNAVNQFKISHGTTDNFVETPFSGTRDTTVYMQSGTMLKLDTKATSNNLSGSIIVDDVVKVTGTDVDLDGDGKTQVKIEYRLL